MRDTIRKAYLEVCGGYSSDRVVADPALNGRFIEVCRQFGLSEPATELNTYLLNARKAGAFSDLPRARKTSFADEEEYCFASEVAARFLEQRDKLTVDQIICDPEVACEFESVAQKIAPGYSSLQYRWAALNLRKAKRLSPELLSHVVACDCIDLGPVHDVDASRLPIVGGVYVFYGPTVTLYVGETGNLRKRVGRHLDHSDNKGLAHWFWQNGFSQVHLEIRALPKDTPQRVRSALEREVIRSRKPVFNIQHV